MEEALSRQLDQVFLADEFAALPAAHRDTLRDSLECTACGADAYFIREARNGRRACFGARPHAEDCELASLATADGGGVALDEVEERINAGDVFRIDAARSRAIRHVRHEPSAAPTSGGRAYRYTRRGKRDVRISSMGISRLLRQLVLREQFRSSDTLLIMSDDSRQTVRSGCVHVKDVEAKHANRLRVYWGTFRFPHPKEDGGAWLNTGRRGSPTVVIKDDNVLLQLLDVLGVEEIDDLAGCDFAYMGKLRIGPSGRTFLFVDELDWFAARPFDADAVAY